MAVTAVLMKRVFMNFRKYDIPNEINVRMKATHFNFVNKNSVSYTTDAVTNGAKSWVSPYQKPKLVGHDKTRDPIGRIIDYRIVTSDAVDEPPDYLELVAKITDSSSIEKVLDGRYSTVSVGSRSSRVLCSECGQNIIKDGLCEHKKGTRNEQGKRIHWVIDQIDYVESSFVNEPADEYAGIDAVDLGTGWISYKDFLDNRETILTELKLEDSYMDVNKLTYKARTNLPDSAFCYVVSKDGKKVRKFPAHDAAHVRNGLAKIATADELSESAKRKILAGLKRRAKRFEISVNEDFLATDAIEYIDSIGATEGLNEAWTPEEIESVDKLFNTDPDFDVIPENNDSTEDTQEDQTVEPEKMKKDELVSAYKKLQEDYNTNIEAKDAKIKDLEDKTSELSTILVEREDEINKYLDQVADLDKQLRDSLIANLVDLKTPDTKEDAEAMSSKYQSRSLESLKDCLEDLRLESNSTNVESENKVEDPTTHENSDSSNQNNTEEKTNDPWAVFSQDNRQVEVI